MLQLRVREYSATGVKGRILPHVEGSLNWTASENGSPVLEFSLTDTVADRRPDDGFAVGVEYSVDGGRFQSIPYHDRFIMNQNDGDDTDPTKTVKFTGESLALWKLARTYVHWASNAVDKIRKVSSLPNGHFDYFFKESKARGWGTDITFPYTYGKDSSGATWPVADAVELEWSLGTPLTDVLTTLTDGGLCDWTVVGTEFKMYRPGTLGVDRSELLLSSAQVKRAPIKADVSGLISHISVMSDSGNWQYLSTPETKWGKLEATMSMSGVGDYAVASKMAQPALDEGSKAKREEAYEWDSATLTLTPFRDFNIGDTITVNVRGARSSRKVIGFVLGQEGVSTTVRAILGESISSTQKKILERVTSATVGGIIGGTGNGFPASVGPSPLAPAKPNGLVVTSNIGEWLGDGSALATVELSWPDVTESVDGSEATISHYEILSRLPSETLSLTTTTHHNNVYIDRWAPGIPRLVAVVAVATNGQRSEPSLEVEVTPQMPSSVVPKAPTGLAEVSNTGEFTSNGPVATVVLSWTAVTESTDDEPITIEGYEVFADGVPVARVTGTSATVKLTSTAVMPYSVRAITNTGVAGDPSTALNVTGANPALVTRVPTTPTLTTGYGNVFARWNGSYASGGTVGAHSVRVEARVGTSGSWVVQGTLIATGEQLISAGTVGETVQVRLIAIDQLSRVTGTSATASTVREGLDLAGLSEDVLDEFAAIESAASAAQGAAAAAQDDADQAIADALAAANAAAAADSKAADAKVVAESALRSLPDLITAQPESSSGWVLREDGTFVFSSNGGGWFPFTEVSVSPGQIIRLTATWEREGAAGDFLCGLIPKIGDTWGVAGQGWTPTGSRWAPEGMSYSDLYPTRTRDYVIPDDVTAVRFAAFVNNNSAEEPVALTSILLQDVTEQVRLDAATAAAQNTANSKGKTIIQSSAPATADQLAQNLWIDTTGGNNTPKRWSGSAWVAVTDKAATDAAAAAVTAKNRADDAFVAATAAATAAGNAQTTANGKNRVWYQTTQPTGTGHRVDDVWYDTDDGYKMHRWTGSIWSATQFGTNAIANLAITNAQIANATIQDAKIATLDAAKITTGYLAAARIAANTIVAEHLSTDSVTAAKILADEAFFTKVFTNALMAGRVETDHLSSNVGETLNITSNESVQIMVSQQEQLSSDVSAAQAAAENAQGLATDASIAAGEASGAAQTANNNAANAQSTAEQAAANIAAQQAVFVVTATGADVRSVDATSIVRIVPTGISIVQNSTDVSSWSGSQFNVGQIVVRDVGLTQGRIELMGNHAIERSGTRTVFKKL